MKFLRLLALLLAVAWTNAIASAASNATQTSLIGGRLFATLSDNELVEIYAELTRLTKDANDNPVLYPTDTTTYAVTVGSTTVQVPYNMVYVPAGSFTVGTGSTATTSTTDAYCIGKYEVTNAEYKEFLTATSSTSYPAHWSNGTYPAGKANHPVLYISLTNALAYCAWISAQTGWAITIPTSDQWEKAARGPNAYLYPWGNSLDTAYSSSTGVITTKFNYNGVTAAYYLFNRPNDAVTYSNTKSPYYGTATTVSKIAAYDTSGSATLFSINSSGSVSGWVNHDTYTGFIYTSVYDTLMDSGGNTASVGTYPAGASAYGCYDMAGNVFEWTTTLITATNGAEAGVTSNEVRGGSWYSTGTSGKSISIGEGRSASGAFNTVGFRIVRNLTASTATTTTTTTTTSTTGGTTSSGTSSSTSTSSSGGGGGGAPSHWFYAALLLLTAGRRWLRARG